MSSKSDNQGCAAMLIGIGGLICLVGGSSYLLGWPGAFIGLGLGITALGVLYWLTA